MWAWTPASLLVELIVLAVLAVACSAIAVLNLIDWLCDRGRD